MIIGNVENVLTWTTANEEDDNFGSQNRLKKKKQVVTEEKWVGSQSIRFL